MDTEFDYENGSWPGQRTQAELDAIWDDETARERAGITADNIDDYLP